MPHINADRMATIYNNNMILVLLFSAVAYIGAFTNPMIHNTHLFHQPKFSDYDTPSAKLLQMSTVPDHEDDILYTKNNIVDQFKNLLPPKPEDQIALGGDIVALLTYTYLDHIINEIFIEASAEMDVAELVAYDPNTASGGVQLPVWFDSANLATFGKNWLAHTHTEVAYAPAISASGLAFVSISICWMICGYFSGAFLNENTLNCNVDKAMKVTFKTWIGTCILMIMLALSSDAMWGWLDSINALSAPARGGLTTYDADYIFDSLTVLAFWRVMYNWLLGYR